MKSPANPPFPTGPTTWFVSLAMAIVANLSTVNAAMDGLRFRAWHDRELQAGFGNRARLVWHWLLRRAGGIHTARLSHGLMDAALRTWGLVWLGYL